MIIAMEDYSCAMRATVETKQMGYIARLPWSYGDVNRPCPRALPSDSVALHKSLAPCCDYITNLMNQ